MMKAVFRLKPLDRAPPPTNPIGRFCHHMAYHPWFDNIMTGIIIANVVLLGTTYYGESASFAAGKGAHMRRMRAFWPKEGSAFCNAGITVLHNDWKVPRLWLPAAKEHANTAFSSIVILEFVIKFAAMGPRLYWRNNWNKFDVALTVASLIDIITQVTLDSALLLSAGLVISESIAFSQGGTPCLLCVRRSWLRFWAVWPTCLPSKRS